MISPIANLFLYLRNSLSALADAHGNKYFSFIDQDLGQLDQSSASRRPAVALPAALIDISGITYSSKAEKVQSGECTVRISLVYAPLSATSSLSPDEYTQKALYCYELEQLVSQSVHGATPSYSDGSGPDLLQNTFGKFNRIASETLNRKNGLRVRELTFKIAFDDYSLQSGTALHPASFSLTEEMII